MKILPDSNIWISGFATHGLCADLMSLALRWHGLGDFELLTCAQVRDETTRILRDKFKANASDLTLVRSAMAFAHDVPAGEWVPPAEFPDPDDVPIVSAAIAAAANVLVTGDLALLRLQQIDSVEIVTARTAYERLREIA